MSESETQEDKYIQAKEVCEILGVDRQKLYQWQKRKLIKSTANPLNNYRLYLRKDVEEFKKKLKIGEVK